MTPTGHEPGQTFPVVQDKCAHNTASDKADVEALRAPEAHPRMNCGSKANIPVSQIMVEMVDRCVVSYHWNAGRIAPSERGRAHSPDSG